ncbi:PorP/SprF family type IX secretion system membrane protein, partial [Paraflavisolibacter sp. H34]|uniref:PorP/SprF family type IX secretion system membrane protein n=1 Tax=Huijunlia imazamoxiresistens TaxID=3127457 RepID=UPI00301731FF
NFSQFYELPLLRNPALAGIYNGDVRLTSAYRNQWQAVTTPYQTMALGSEVKFAVSEASNDYFSLGLQVTNDVAGDSRMGKTQVLPLLAFHKSVNGDKDSYLSAGFLGGAVQHRFDPTKLTFDDQFVGGSFRATNATRQTFSNTNVTYWDAAAGLSYSSVMGYDTRYYIGAGLFHFNQPKVAFNRANDFRLNRKFVFNAGLNVPTGEWDRLTLYGDYFVQGGNSQGQGGFLFTHNLLQEDEEESVDLVGGLFCRWNDAVIPMVKLNYYKLAVGLSYDVNISKLKTASNLRGGMELTLSYKSFLNIRNSSL